MCSNMLIVYLQNTFKANEIMEEEYNSCISAVPIFGVLNNLEYSALSYHSNRNKCCKTDKFI